MEATPRLWIEFIEMRFDKHLVVSNTISIQNYYSLDCPGKEKIGFGGRENEWDIWSYINIETWMRGIF